MTIITYIFERKVYRFDSSAGTDISIPVRLRAEDQLKAFGSEFDATATLIGGGIESGNVGFNADKIEFCVHLNGTHTECVGHISNPQYSFPPEYAQLLRDSYLPAAVVTIVPLAKDQHKETYTPDLEPEDKVITASALGEAFASAHDWDINKISALVIRTTPNNDSKKTRDYTKEPSVFLSNEAMEFLAKHDNLHHLVVDGISVDRAEDDGHLSNHHTWWNMAQGSHEIIDSTRTERTITEIAYVPNSIEDGFYFLNIQPVNFEGTDALTSTLALFEPELAA